MSNNRFAIGQKVSTPDGIGLIIEFSGEDQAEVKLDDQGIGFFNFSRITPLEPFPGQEIEVTDSPGDYGYMDSEWKGPFYFIGFNRQGKVIVEDPHIAHECDTCTWDEWRFAGTKPSSFSPEQREEILQMIKEHK